MTLDQLFILFVSGLLLTYISIATSLNHWYTVAGLGCACAAIVEAAQYSIRPLGLALLIAAAALFAAEFLVRPTYIAGFAGAALLAAGAANLYRGPLQIKLGVALPFGLLLGSATAIICAAGKRARMNKRADL